MNIPIVEVQDGKRSEKMLLIREILSQEFAKYIQRVEQEEKASQLNRKDQGSS